MSATVDGASANQKPGNQSQLAQEIDKNALRVSACKCLKGTSHRGGIVQIYSSETELV
jgi:hypothetical protein